MSILGTRVLRTEDPRLLRGAGRFIADLGPADDPRLAGALWVTFVRSTLAHAAILDIDASEALAAPGVVAVITATDLDVVAPPAMGGALGPEVVRPFLAGEVVRFVGDAIAAVVTERPEQGADAAELVVVDYDPLEPVPDVDTALAGDVLVFPTHGSNVVASFGAAPDHDMFDGCEVVVRQRMANQRLAPAPIEPRGCVACWEHGHLTFWTSTQSVHSVRNALVEQLGVAREDLRVITPDVGGGFGAKMSLYRDEAVVAWIARHLGRPTRWVETRTESMVVMHHGRGQVHDVAIGGTREGRVLAYHLSIVQDAGAYPETGAFLPYMTRLMAQGCYEIDRVSVDTRSVLTTTTPTAAYRGAGRPEAAAAIERSMDLFAAEVGLDPAEVRRRNLIPAEAFPYTTRTKATYDVGDYPQALERALEAAGYAELRTEQARRRAEGRGPLLGIGMAVYVEITAGPGAGEMETARIEIDRDGRATVYTGSSSHGQGHDTSFAMLVSAETGIAVQDVTVVHGDTDAIPEGTGTWGSRSLQVGGAALHRATEHVIERARAVAAKELDAEVDDIELDPASGRFDLIRPGLGDGGPGDGLSWADLAACSSEPLIESHEYLTDAPSFPFGAHVAVVSVDPDTGRVTLDRIVTVDDAGRILNPLVVEGQRHGGIAQGVAQALVEEVVFDADANPQTANLADYGLISATELVDYELVVMETPTPLNALGAKGIGESGTVGATPAVQNAVVDALAHLGVRHVDLPCTPERVWRAIQQTEANREEP